ncbi:hypothetical protein Ancab_014661 [Ancistrocladus abbreviatus]
MQTPKKRNGSSDVPQKTSSATPRTVRELKTPGSDSNAASSPNPSSRAPKTRSPKVTDRGSPQSPITEKKRPGRVSEIESQLTQLQEEFKKVKDQLNSSETQKRRAQQEAEETKKQLVTMTAKFEESQQQLLELSASEEARVQELRKISQDRDRAWQSELEAVQKQHSMDSTALASAMHEIHKLKKQLEMVAESEAKQCRHAESAHAEIQSLRIELSETLILVEKMKNQLNECKESEAHALEVASEAQMQLEEARAIAETLRSEGLKAMEAYHSLASELEQSKSQVYSLEMLVSKLQSDLAGNSADPLTDVNIQDDGKSKETEKLREEVDSLKVEVGQLKSALEASERRYQEEYIQSTLEIRNAYDEVERTKTESSIRESKVEEALEQAKVKIEELKLDLMSKETMLQTMSNENSEMNSKIEDNQTSVKESELVLEVKKLGADLTDLKEALLDKETQLQGITEENEMLKMEIKKWEMEKSKSDDEAVALAEVAKAAEREALMRLGYVTEEADKNSRKAARVVEQLDAAQTANTELEAELRRLKVQSDQWRKAAEAAAAMLSPGSNGKFVDRSVLLDSSYHTVGAKMDSPFSDDTDDDSPKKKNGNMLKKIGVLWKKGQK